MTVLTWRIICTEKKRAVYTALERFDWSEIGQMPGSTRLQSMLGCSLSSVRWADAETLVPVRGEPMRALIASTSTTANTARDIRRFRNELGQGIFGKPATTIIPRSLAWHSRKALTNAEDHRGHLW